MFYNYRQNNSGGSFDLNQDVNYMVIIEAPTAEAANERAESIGIYFNGCDVGRDCSCCGDRWSKVFSDDSTETPTIYGEPAQDYWFNEHWPSRWGADQAIIIYYQDAPKEIIYAPPVVK
jgi:hypothetical protein